MPFDLGSALPGLFPLACEWAEKESTRILQAGIGLGEAGLALATCVGVRDPARIRVLIVPSIPRPNHPALLAACDATGLLGPTARGLTLGHGVVVQAGHERDPYLLAHEFRHVSQYEGFGSIRRFLQDYLPQLIEHGYENAPLELDAVHASKRCA